MQGSQKALFFRHDTFLGVCEGLGQDFGFNPTYLRLALALALLLAPVATFLAYVGIGVLIAVSRWIFPPSNAEATVPASVIAPSIRNDNDPEAIELANAA